MQSLMSEADVDLDAVYADLDGLIEEDWVSRLEKDFGAATESHVFFQTDNYNGFLYSNRATLHILEQGVEEDPVYQVIEDHYGEQAKDLL